MKRLVLTGVATLLVSLVMPAWGAPSHVQTLLARYDFNRAGTGALVVSGSMQIGPGALFATTMVDLTDPAQARVLFPDVLDLGQVDGARSFGAAGNHTLCQAPLTCSVRGDTFSFGITDTVFGSGARSLHFRFYVAARGRNIKLHDQLRTGWTAHHRRDGLVVRTDADATGIGADVEGYDVGALTGVDAAGPRAGSVAIAIPGCDVIGAGLLTLTGGRQPASALCPADAIGAYAARATHWVAAGAAIGVSANQTRLLVLAN